MPVVPAMRPVSVAPTRAPPAPPPSAPAAPAALAPPGTTIVAPAVSAPSATEDTPALPPATAWRAALAGLTTLNRTLVEDNAAFVRFHDGLLVLAARSERLAGQVRERVREADFTAHLPGFRNVEVVCDAVGRTGNEARAAGDERRRTEARAAAEASPALARVRAAFDAVLESVEPLSGEPAAPIFEEEDHEE